MAVQTVGRYEIVEELGSGAMGLVFKALDPTIGRVVALKTMRIDVHGLERGEVFRRFKNEARAAGLLNHPNIVTIYDAGEQEGMFYIAMEFMEGITLQSLLSQNSVLPIEETVRISRQICQGLDYAHANGIIHRDVKPANIMITSGGTVKIMDFGIAKTGVGTTNPGQVLGTPSYMSPEQIKGGKLDGRSDLFSFGVALYEMLTGEKPFSGQNITTVIYKIVNEDPIPPRDLDASIPQGLNLVVTKALAKAPGDRYQTGAELVRDLENYQMLGGAANQTASFPTVALDRSEVTHAANQGFNKTIAETSAQTSNGKNAKTSVQTLAELPASKPMSRKRRGVLVLVLTLAALVMAAAGGYLFYLYRTDKTIQASDEALEKKISDQQHKEAAAFKTAKSKPSPFPSSSSSKSGAAAPALGLSPKGAKFVVNSTPPGASIEVDGANTGSVTPAEIAIEKGQHTLVLRKTGFNDATITQAVQDGQRVNVSPVLAQAAPSEAIPAGKGLVHIHTAPEGATIEVDNRVAPHKTNVVWPVAPGDYSIVLRMDGYKPVRRTIHVDEGNQVFVDEILERQP